MTDIKLSICIPTYNFGKYIGQTLDSILIQRRDDIEIVIGDGDSTDNTEEIVNDYSSRFPNIKYYKFEKKGGIDLDLVKTIEMAKGEYCWLLSSDDVLDVGAIAKVIKEIRLGCSIYLCNRFECDEKLKNSSAQFWLAKKVKDRTFHFSRHGELLSYLMASQSLGALFSFMSAIIVKRSTWLGSENAQSLMGSNYAHVHRIFSIALKGGSLRYIQEPLILARFGNDSFMEHGLARRFLIDLNGYKLIINMLFHDQEIGENFKSVMRREHKWYRLPSLAYKVGTDDWKKLFEGLCFFGYKPALLRIYYQIGRSKIYNHLYNYYKN
jgi:abequosyltransferase